MARNASSENGRGIRRRGAVALAAVAVALSMGAAQSAVAGPGDSATASRARKSVDIDGFAFHPPTLRVGKGTTVAFVNSSGTAHTATDTGGFDTGRIPPGKSVAVRFAQKGSFAYHCTIHPFMHGRIVVE